MQRDSDACNSNESDRSHDGHISEFVQHKCHSYWHWLDSGQLPGQADSA